MTDQPDPDSTQDIHLPPPVEPTRQLRKPPPPGPTSQIRRPPQRNYPLPTPHPPARPGEEPPWWQTINRDRETSAPPTPVEQQLPASHPVQPHPASALSQPTGQVSSPRLPRIRFVSGGVAIAATVAIVLGAILGTQNERPTKVLDISKAQEGVAGVLLDPVSGYGVRSLGPVACNNGSNPVVRQGESFICDVVVDGANRRVAVVFQDDSGTYAVDRPR